MIGAILPTHLLDAPRSANLWFLRIILRLPQTPTNGVGQRHDHSSGHVLGHTTIHGGYDAMAYGPVPLFTPGETSPPHHVSTPTAILDSVLLVYAQNPSAPISSVSQFTLLIRTAEPPCAYRQPSASAMVTGCCCSESPVTSTAAMSMILIMSTLAVLGEPCQAATVRKSH